MRPRGHAHLDADLLDHPKVFAAGELIGKNGPAVALGFYSVALMWTNKYLSDGFLSKATIKSFAHMVDNPTSIADALTQVGLFDRFDGGWKIHHFHHRNPSVADVTKRRKKDRERHQND